MPRLRRLGICACLSVGLILFIVSVEQSKAQVSQAAQGARKHVPVCPGPHAATDARCHARVIVNQKGQPLSSTSPSGYGPQQFRSGYSVTGVASSKQIIAIVDAYHDPFALSDLNTYSKTFSVPAMKSCPVSTGTVSAPCFQQVSQSGTARYPRTNAGWALEISLDVQAAHALCQNCNILLVEATSNSYSNLLSAVDRAVVMGATEISNSYGSGEFSSEGSYDGHFNHPGIAITVSSGDSGFGAQWPAASPYVTAVGGTTLTLNSDNSYNSESAWSGSGSGCSDYESKPIAQTLVTTFCTNRTVADVSADADPNTGAAIYDSVGYGGQTGWFQVGGTSLASPLIAAIYALGGGVPAGIQGNTLPYQHGVYGTSLHDVVSGTTANCDGSFLCTSTTGYDGATGLGTPLGFGAF